VWHKIDDRDIPEGWLDGGTAMSDHNNYDVAELFYRGWIHMVPRQRQAASAAVNDDLVPRRIG
jgi:hypothetical protein